MRRGSIDVVVIHGRKLWVYIGWQSVAELVAESLRVAAWSRVAAEAKARRGHLTSSYSHMGQKEDRQLPALLREVQTLPFTVILRTMGRG